MPDQPKRVFVIDVLRAYFESGAAANMEASRCCLLTAICMEFDRFYGKRAISWRVKKVIDVTGMSRNTVVDSRNELVEEGWLHVVPGVHKRKACLYTPLIPAGCDEYGHHLSSMNEDSLNIVSTLAQDSLKIVSTSSQDGLGPYIPIPSPTPTPNPDAIPAEDDLPFQYESKVSSSCRDDFYFWRDSKSKIFMGKTEQDGDPAAWMRLWINHAKWLIDNKIDMTVSEAFTGYYEAALALKNGPKSRVFFSDMIEQIEG